MPYIPQERRDRLDASIDDVFNRVRIKNWTTEEENPFDKIKGEYNYVFYSLIKKALNHYGMSYSKCQDLIGTLECSKLELYRRIMSEYESQKIKEHGDVA